MSTFQKPLLTAVQGTASDAPNYKPNGMIFRRLGKSGLKLPVFGLGGWLTYGGTVSGDPVKEIIKTAFEAGINFFDQAENYSDGRSELEMGRCFRELGYKRSDLILSTKVFNGYGREGPNDRGLSRKHVLEGVQDSLDRLGVDYIDIVYCHCYDPDVPMEEIVRAFNHLISQGKILYWGTSCWLASQIQDAIATANRLGLVAPVVEQPWYNMLERERVEDELKPIFDKYSYGSTVFFALAKGALTGKYNDGIPADSRFATAKADPYVATLGPRLQTEEGKKEIETVKKLTAYAKERLDASIVHLALAWCLTNPNVSNVILGASRPAQILDNVKALDVLPKLTPEVLADINAILKN